jgi:2-deoxy-D-gluconate 3-dehydrogenase
MATNNTTALRADAVREKEIVEQIPAGRWGTPEDLQGAAVFLRREHRNILTAMFLLLMADGWHDNRRDEK